MVEDLLDGWPGTLILVTHDRYLMERVTDDQYALIDGQLQHLPGGVDEYLKIMDSRSAQADSRSVTTAAVAATATEPQKLQPPKSALSGGQQRELRKQMASLERKMETLKGKIVAAQERMGTVDPSDYLVLGAIQEEIAQLQEQLEEMELEWLEAAEILGA